MSALFMILTEETEERLKSGLKIAMANAALDRSTHLLFMDSASQSLIQMPKWLEGMLLDSIEVGIKLYICQSSLLDAGGAARDVQKNIPIEITGLVSFMATIAEKDQLAII